MAARLRAEAVVVNIDAIPSDLSARAAAVSIRIHATETELRAALLDGAPAGDIRARLAELRRDAAAIAVALSDEDAAREHEAAAAIEARAKVVAQEAVARLRATMAALRMPAGRARRGQ